MDNDKLPVLFYWTYYKDGTVETNFPASTQPPPSTEPHFYDYDKLIAESEGLYRQWWILWKRIHPEWALIPEEPKELIIKLPPKPKVTLGRMPRNDRPS